MLVLPQGEHRAHACFTHAVIYLGSGWIYEATPANGVGPRELRTLPPDLHIRARRFRDVTQVEQQRICDEATQLGGQYAAVQAFVDLILQGAPSPALALISSLMAHTFGVSPRQSFYCSMLVEAAYVNALGASTISHPTLASAMPWTLSSSTYFEEVPIAW
jgi:hypothetical protein